MATIKLPEIGENIEKGTITSISVSKGDAVKKDQTILELETDKAVVEIPSPESGTVEDILVNAGDEINVGQDIFVFGERSGADNGEDTKEESDSKQKDNDKKESKEEDRHPEKQSDEGSQKDSSTPAKDPAPWPSGQGGQSDTDTTPPPSTSAHQPKSNEAIPAQKNVNASPSVRRFARELGVDLTQVTGSGPGGRISTDDVKAYIKQVFQSGGPNANTAGGGIPSRPLPDFSKYGETRREKMSKIRQVTGDQMSFCWQTIPHVTQFDKANVSSLDKFRRKISTKDRKVTITPFLLKVMAAALKEFPEFNASIDPASKEIIYKDFFHIGVAVDTPRGLIVPKIRDVETKGILQLTDELNEMAGRARDGKTGLDELQGGSMTLTNLGGIGGHAFTPIVNWPEVCILGVSRGSYEPVWDGKAFVPQMTLPLSLSYDHRLIDGANAARFLRWICEAIEQPFLLDLK